MLLFRHVKKETNDNSTISTNHCNLIGDLRSNSKRGIYQNIQFPTDNLKARGYNMPGICYMCRIQDEIVQHLFNECGCALQIYGRILQGGTRTIPDQDYLQLLVNSRTTTKEKELVLIAQFIIWRERCCRIFRDKSKRIEELVQEVRMQWTQSAKTKNRRQSQLREVNQ